MKWIWGNFENIEKCLGKIRTDLKILHPLNYSCQSAVSEPDEGEKVVGGRLVYKEPGWSSLIIVSMTRDKLIFILLLSGLASNTQSAGVRGKVRFIYLI